jgi:hypothetical protein
MRYGLSASLPIISPRLISPLLHLPSHVPGADLAPVLL